MDIKIKIILGLSVFSIIGWVLFCVTYFTKPVAIDTTKTDKKIEELVQKSNNLGKIDSVEFLKIDTIQKDGVMIKEKLHFLSLKEDSLIKKNLTTIKDENTLLNYIDNSNGNELYGFFANQKQ